MRCIGAFLILALSANLNDAMSCHRSTSGCRRCATPRLLPDHDCPLYGYDCKSNLTMLHDFRISKSPETGCLRLECGHPEARVFVDRKPYFTLRCRDYRWRFGPRDCDYSSHAICARPCTCTPTLPKFIDDIKFSLPSVYPPSPLRPCPVAYCVGRDSSLYGVSANGKQEQRIVAGELTCTGDDEWRDSEGDTFKFALCAGTTRPPGPGGPGACVTGCNPPTDAATPPFGYKIRTIDFPVPESNSTCTKLTCKEGNLTVNKERLQLHDVYCYLVEGSPTFRTIIGEIVTAASCVSSCKECVDDGFTDLMSIRYRHTGTQTNSVTGCTETLPCPDGYKLQWRVNVTMTPKDFEEEIAECGINGRWEIGDNARPRGWRVACASEADPSCTNGCSLDKLAPIKSKPGFHVFDKPTIRTTHGCEELVCEKGGEIATGTSGSFGNSVQCKTDQVWMDEDDKTVEKASCISDCTLCENSIVYSDGDYLKANTDLDDNDCKKVDKATACKNGGQLYSQEDDDKTPTIVTDQELICEGVGWRVNTKTVVKRVGCKLPACTTDCVKAPQANVKHTDVPKFYAISSLAEVDDGDGSCMKLKCDSNFKLIVNSGGQLDPDVKCVRGEWKTDDQIVRKASCIGECNVCDMTFAEDGYKAAPIVRDDTTGCLRANKCPPPFTDLYYLDEGGVPKPENTYSSTGTCLNGKWSGDAGATSADRVGCKFGCAHCESLHFFKTVDIPGFTYIDDPKEPDHECKSYKCANGQLAILNESTKKQKIAASVCCDENGEWKVDGNAVQNPFNITCVKSCRGCVAEYANAPDGYVNPIFYTEQKDGCLAAHPCGNNELYADFNTITLSDDDKIICSINGKWSVRGNEYDKIACLETGVCTTGCIVPTVDADVLYGYAIDPDDKAHAGGDDTCATLECTSNYLVINKVGIESSVVRCMNVYGKLKFMTAAGEEVTKASCVRPCTKCMDIGFPDLDDAAAYRPVGTKIGNHPRGCTQTLSCPDGHELYYLEDPEEKIPRPVNEKTVVCSLHSTWTWTGGPSGGASLVACKVITGVCSTGCTAPTTNADQVDGYAVDDMDSPQSVGNDTCETLTCSDYNTLAVNEGVLETSIVRCLSVYGKSKFMTADGEEVKTASCVSSCTTCMDVGFFGFDEYRPTGTTTTAHSGRCTTTISCPSGNELYYLDGGGMKVPTGVDTVVCGLGGRWTWSVGPNGGALFVACKVPSAPSCTTGCDVSELVHVTYPPKYFGLFSAVSSGNEGGCDQLKCNDPSSVLTVGDAEELNPAVKCIGNDWMLANGDPVTNASCVKPCFACNVSFDYDGYQPAETELNPATGCLEANICPGSTELYYVGEEEEDGPASLGRTAASCGADGQWHTDPEQTDKRVLQVGCQKPCAHCAELDAHGSFTIDGYLNSDEGSVNKHNGCNSYKCIGAQIAILDTTTSQQHIVSSVCCGDDGAWKVDGITNPNDFKIGCVKSCRGCSATPPNGAAKAVFDTDEDGCFTALPCADGNFLVDGGNTVPLNDKLVCQLNGKWEAPDGNSYDRIGCAKDLCTKCSPLAEHTFEIKSYSYSAKAELKMTPCMSYTCNNDFPIGVKYESGKTEIIHSLQCNGGNKWEVNGEKKDGVEDVGCFKGCASCSQQTFADYIFPTLKDSTSCLEVEPCGFFLMYYYNTTAQDYQKDDNLETSVVCGEDGKWQFSQGSYPFIGCKPPTDCGTGCDPNSGFSGLTTLPNGFALLANKPISGPGLTCQELVCSSGQLATSQTDTPPVRVYCTTADQSWKKDGGTKITTAACVGVCTGCVSSTTLGGYKNANMKNDGENGCSQVSCSDGGNLFYMGIDGKTKDSGSPTAVCNGEIKWQFSLVTLSNVFCKVMCASCTTILDIPQNEFVLNGFIWKARVTSDMDDSSGCDKIECNKDYTMIAGGPPYRNTQQSSATCLETSKWESFQTDETKAACAIGCTQCTIGSPSANGYSAPEVVVGYGGCTTPLCLTGKYYYKSGNKYENTNSVPKCEGSSWLVDGSPTTSIACKAYCKPLGDANCPASDRHICAQLLVLSNSDSQNDKYECKHDGDLYVADDRNPVSMQKSFIQCKPSQKDWHIQGDGFNGNPRATCRYECERDCNKTPPNGQTRAASFSNTPCMTASCTNGDQLVGYTNNKPLTFIGSASCVDDKKWLSPDTKLFFDSVGCTSPPSK